MLLRLMGRLGLRLSCPASHRAAARIVSGDASLLTLGTATNSASSRR